MLTIIEIQNTKPQSKSIKLFDGRGLYLEISPNDSRGWRLKYRFAGKEKRISLGVYPEVSLKEAREKCDAARKQIAAGIDPSDARKLAKIALRESVANTFEAVAREWFAKYSPTWNARYAERILHRLETDAFPWLGSRPIKDIKPFELLSALRRIENRGALETAHRIQQSCSKVFRYAVATARAERDITVDLRGALPPTKEKHHASLTEPKAVGNLMRAIDGYQGSFVIKCALRLAPLVFVRPGELRYAEWGEIDFEGSEWRIAAERMKMKARHIVPLSRQALAVLRELHPLTGQGRYLFPGAAHRDRPMSENTINGALRRLGYTSQEMTGHGFRSMASTLLNERGWNRDAIERQLAHAERDSVRAAYNYAEHLPERREMMQSWADYLDSLAVGAMIVPFKMAKTA